MTAVYYAKTIFYEADFIKIFTITRGTQLSWYCKCNLTLVYLSYIFYVAMNQPKILFIFSFFSFSLLKIAGELSKIKYWSATVASCLIQEIHFWQTVVPITRGTLGDSGHRNTAKKFEKYRNTAKKIEKYRNTAKKSPNTATPQYQVKTRCKPEISTLYVTLSANNIEITTNVPVK